MQASDLEARLEHALGSPATRTDPRRLPAPPRVPDHELIRPIGAGSYGEVWLARSVTGQWRAVKVVARARFESDRPFEREFRGVVQFEPISRSHGGLIPVLHVGRDDAVGAFYYIMELADADTAGSGEESAPGTVLPARADGPGRSPAGDDGVSLYRPRTLRSDLASRGRLSVAETVALGVQLCGALGHLHRHGLVHRDVKPSNVIFVQGQPKLADLGLVATAVEARSFVGTEGFIPPEGPGTPKADLFALGRLLYEAATGKDRCEFPEVPPDLDAWPDRDAFLELNEVLSRLCAPEPHRRCANAAEAAGDLNLLLAGRSIRRAYGVERRLKRATRITTLALGILALAAAAVGIQELRQRQAEMRAAEERTLRVRAETAERQSRQQLYTALLEQARATVHSGELGQRVRALEAIRRAAAIRNTAELRREAIAALALPDLRFERELPWGSGFTSRELDPAFERLAVCAGRGPVEVRAVSDHRLLATLAASTNLRCYNATWSGDGRFLAVKRDHDHDEHGCDLEVWDLRTDPRRLLRVRDARRNVRAFHPGRPHFLTADAHHRIVSWDLDRGAERSRSASLPGAPSHLVFSPQGDRFAAINVCTDKWLVTLHAAATGNQLRAVPFTTSASTIAWHPQGRWLAITDMAGNAHLLDPESGVVRTLGRHRAEAVTAVFDPSGDYLFTGGWERSLICWDLRTMQRAFVIELDSYQMQMRADGRQCALLTLGGVQLYAVESPVQRQFAEDLGPRLRFAAFSADRRWLAASADESLGVWDLEDRGTGTLLKAGAEASPFWTPDGRELFASRRDDVALRWRVRPASVPGTAPRLDPLELRTPPGFAWLSLASNQVVWTGTNGSQIVGLDRLHPEANHWRRTAPGMNGCSPDGNWLGVYRGYTPVLYVYRRPDLELVARLTCRANISGFQFSPRGDEVAIASRGQVEFWSTQTWQPTRTLTNFAGIPHVGLLAQPDGRGWWLAPEQRFAGFYAAASLELEWSLPSTMAPLALSPDSRLIAVSVEARRLEVWDLGTVRLHLRELGLDWLEVGDSP